MFSTPATESLFPRSWNLGRGEGGAARIVQLPPLWRLRRSFIILGCPFAGPFNGASFNCRPFYQPLSLIIRSLRNDRIDARVTHFRHYPLCTHSGGDTKNAKSSRSSRMLRDGIGRDKIRRNKRKKKNSSSRWWKGKREEGRRRRERVDQGGIIKRGLSDNAVYKARNDSRNIKVSGRRGRAFSLSGSRLSLFMLLKVINLSKRPPRMVESSWVTSIHGKLS